jgi:uncharacterized damage-inducible protein DinB
MAAIPRYGERTTVAQTRLPETVPVNPRNAEIHMFGQSPVQWLGYLIAHESHQRGQIMLALKQSRLQLPEGVAEDELWGPWIDG